jgi:hypothetical protein
MRKTILISIALLALLGSTVGLSAAETETVNGKDSIIIESITPAAKPMPGVGVSTELDQHRYRSYEYTEAGGSFRLTLPEGLAVVRGILVVGPYAGADSREFYREVWYREFMHLHDFAFLGTHGVSMQNYKLMENALKQLAADSKHPELVHAPYVATGFSAGGGFARRLLLADPDRVIAAVIVSSTLKLAVIPTVPITPTFRPSGHARVRHQR